MGLLEEFNRYLTGRNSAKFLEFRCPRCGHAESYLPDFFSDSGGSGTCGRCSYQYGLHPESVFFRCICGVGVYGIGIDSVSPLEAFAWGCNACGRTMFVSEPSSLSCAYLCGENGCAQIYFYSFDDAKFLIEGSFLCACSRRIRPPSKHVGQEVSIRCPGCLQVWAFKKSDWEEVLGCGHRVNRSKFESRLLPNIIDRVESPLVSTGMSNELAYRERLSTQTAQLERRLGSEPRRITYRRIIVTSEGMLAEELILE